MDVTTVADDVIVLHDGARVTRYDGLDPGRTYRFGDVEVRTLPRPAGRLLCRFATVNDVHFGEVECGRLDDVPTGPILRVPEGARPYPETMNRGAIDEIAAIDPAAVIVKGDLTADGTPDQFAAFEAFYPPAFG